MYYISRGLSFVLLYMIALSSYGQSVDTNRRRVETVHTGKRTETHLVPVTTEESFKYTSVQEFEDTIITIPVGASAHAHNCKLKKRSNVDQIEDMKMTTKRMTKRSDKITARYIKCIFRKSGGKYTGIKQGEKVIVVLTSSISDASQCFSESACISTKTASISSSSARGATIVNNTGDSHTHHHYGRSDGFRFGDDFRWGYDEYDFRLGETSLVAGPCIGCQRDNLHTTLSTGLAAGFDFGKTLVSEYYRFKGLQSTLDFRGQCQNNALSRVTGVQKFGMDTMGSQAEANSQGDQVTPQATQSSFADINDLGLSAQQRMMLWQACGGLGIGQYAGFGGGMNIPGAGAFGAGLQFGNPLAFGGGQFGLGANPLAFGGGQLGLGGAFGLGNNFPLMSQGIGMQNSVFPGLQNQPIWGGAGGLANQGQFSLGPYNLNGVMGGGIPGAGFPNIGGFPQQQFNI